MDSHLPLPLDFWARRCLCTPAARFWLCTYTRASPPARTSSSGPAISFPSVNTTPAPPPRFSGLSLPAGARSGLFGSAPTPALPCPLLLPATAQ
ncbi:hypothetical protein B0H19DRAFT_1156563 [Mycena capillaripes]|nr:hypothetical protein B0H19DRAFT_1156563 [Mycena capillaripes]